MTQALINKLVSLAMPPAILAQVPIHANHVILTQTPKSTPNIVSVWNQCTYILQNLQWLSHTYSHFIVNPVIIPV